VSKAEQIKRFYEFGPFRVDASERVLLREGQPVMLTPKLFDTLLALVERSGHIVEKAELLETVWPGTFVEESNLSSSVSLLRKTLGTAEDGKPYIETVSRRGYRFAAMVEVTDESTRLIVGRRTRMHVVTREEEETSEQEEIRAVRRESSSAMPAASDRQTTFGTADVQVSGTVEMEAVRPTSSADYRPSAAQRDKRGVIFALSALVIVVAGVFLGLRYVGRNEPATKSVEPFAKIKIARLTTTGRSHDAAISPDGKYVVHVMDSAGQQSLWLRHIATGSDQEIVPSSRDGLSALTFSPDGNRIYFSRFPRFEPGVIALYQVPVLGGPAKKLLEDIDTTVTFSPDSKRLAFMRGDPTRGKRLLIVANADGTGEQVLATHKLEDLFLVGPAWSPNGETIVFPLRGSGPDAPYGNLMEVRLKDGVEKQITSQQWSAIGAICWLRDGSGLVTIAAEQEPGSSWQIWYVSYPAGKVQRITNDLNDYQDVSLTADSSSLVTVQFEQVSDIWMAPDGDTSRASQITTNRFDGVGGISWTPDGRIVHVSRASGNRDIWIMNSDGTGKKQLTFDAGWNSWPSVSPDGRYIIFVSSRTGTPNIWRMDIDGGNQKQLTRGRMAARPQGTPDNQWVIYTSFETGQPTLWKVPIDGGNPVQLSDYYSALIAISPKDGQIAYAYDEESSRRRRVAVIPPEGGPATKVFDFTHPFAQAIRWAVDGRALTYVGNPDRSNIWSQPLDGSPPKQITDFKSAQVIFSFDWSRDGKSLAVARGTRTTDVVLIKDQP
jgi:Tol biopolymer transport system component/DNA-binding winged helix-turn-helix (wHTH) protein